MISPPFSVTIRGMMSMMSTKNVQIYFSKVCGEGM